jgi:hypothetical protein
MKHTILGLIALYITAAVLWIVKEVKEAKDFGLLSGWHYD